MVMIPMILTIALSQTIPLVGKAQFSVSSPTKTKAHAILSAVCSSSAPETEPDSD
ncbi:hypothetical protein PGT21_024648 [Puccinia graminis f. sp. tritici]|uniref:Uncharacterized protein n=1 Tax=Puccinia graminis f. sp. tritici TaxID=56615 RepID=A0A5B0PU87_PUCGR|nr:hypothetical protein PGTUg99_023319 [Puccinia graminis f. sp. tritici]KAA1104476.1 hypothetical protein PGT21_024648 [Puccinia graminis f. sp. tritici]